MLAALGERAAIPPWPTQPIADLLRQPIGRYAPIAPLVRKLTDADVARLQHRFGGPPADLS